MIPRRPGARVIEQHFGESAALSIGIEEELMILDAETLELAPRSQLLVEEAAKRTLPGEVKLELLAPIVEITSGVAASVQEAIETLRTLREGLAEIAGQNGLLIAAAGSHPFSKPEEQLVAAHPRYQEFVGWAGVSARRQAVNGLHVHVGMPSAEVCMHTLEWVLPWLPILLAVSANSPYLAGEETGLASNRAEILAQLPRAAGPPAFRSYAEWEELVERLVRIGVMDDHTRIWWDVRPHPSFGTLEVRVPDQPTELAAGSARARVHQPRDLPQVITRLRVQREDSHDPEANGRSPEPLPALSVLKHENKCTQTRVQPSTATRPRRSATEVGWRR